MHMNDVAKYAAEKEHLMRNEGAHPANTEGLRYRDVWEGPGDPVAREYESDEGLIRKKFDKKTMKGPHSTMGNDG